MSKTGAQCASSPSIVRRPAMRSTARLRNCCTTSSSTSTATTRCPWRSSTGGSGTFCAGADLKAISTGAGNAVGREPPDEIVGSLGPMGPTRLRPRQARHRRRRGSRGRRWTGVGVLGRPPRGRRAMSMFGVYCRRWGVPLIDGGTDSSGAADRPVAGAGSGPHRTRRRRCRGGADRAGEPRRRARRRARGCHRTRRAGGGQPADLHAVRPPVAPTTSGRWTWVRRSPTRSCSGGRPSPPARRSRVPNASPTAPAATAPPLT